jgi:hypothetical protein
MVSRTKSEDGDPRHHIQNLHAMLGEVAQHAREDVDKITDPKAQALFETSAEVLQGLMQAYDHALAKSETAWR